MITSANLSRIAEVDKTGFDGSSRNLLLAVYNISYTIMHLRDHCVSVELSS